MTIIYYFIQLPFLKATVAYCWEWTISQVMADYVAVKANTTPKISSLPSTPLFLRLISIHCLISLTIIIPGKSSMRESASLFYFRFTFSSSSSSSKTTSSSKTSPASESTTSSETSTPSSIR